MKIENYNVICKKKICKKKIKKYLRFIVGATHLTTLKMRFFYIGNALINRVHLCLNAYRL